MNKLQQLVSGCTIDGEQVSFAELLDTLGGSGEIADPFYGKVLDTALQVEPTWEDIEEITIPIVRELLHYTQEEQPAIYRELLMNIKQAHDKLVACKQSKQFIIDKSVDAPSVVDSKFSELMNLIGQGWLVEKLDNRLETDGYLSANLFIEEPYVAEDVNSYVNE